MATVNKKVLILTKQVRDQQAQIETLAAEVKHVKDELVAVGSILDRVTVVHNANLNRILLDFKSMRKLIEHNDNSSNSKPRHFLLSQKRSGGHD